MSRAGNRLVAVVHGFPRVSGDEPRSTITKENRIMFSPRERG